jgi:hypothetical protein
MIDVASSSGRALSWRVASLDVHEDEVGGSERAFTPACSRSQ